MTPLIPRQVAPGWLRRWPQQGWELWKRRPIIWFACGASFTIFNAVVPELVFTQAPFTILETTALFCVLRAIDHDSGNAWATAWGYFRHSARDIAGLTRDIFLIFLLISLVIFSLQWVSAAAAAGAHVLLPKPPTTAAYHQLPWWIRQGANQDNAIIYLSLFAPTATPLMYLTLLVGHSLLQNFLAAFQGVARNIWPATVFFAAGWLASSGLHATIRFFPMKWYGELLLALYGAAWSFLGATAYLWCREMFEGVAQNAPQTQTAKAALALVH